MESRSLLGVSIIKVYFQPGTNADADVTELSNLALADLKRLPPGTLPPVVLKFDASSLPVCLVTLERRGADRNPASRHRPVHHPQPDRGGARAPRFRRPFGGKYRQVDGLRRSLQAALAPVEPDGRGQRGQQEQSDPAGRRREDGAVRLLRLLQQPGEEGSEN